MFVPHKTSHGRPHENKLKSEREKATADARIAGNHSELIKVSFEYCLVSSSTKDCAWTTSPQSASPRAPRVTKRLLRSSLAH